MKKLLFLLIALAPLNIIYAQRDTIFLNSGKYYICTIIDADAQNVQYATSMSAAKVQRIERNEKKGNSLPDMMYLTNGGKIQCKVQSDKNNTIRYAKNISSKMVASLHLHNGKVVKPQNYKSKSPQKEVVQESEPDEEVLSVFADDEDYTEYDILNMENGTRRVGNVVAMTQSILKFMDVESDGRVQIIPLIEIESINYANGQVAIFEDVPSDPLDNLDPAKQKKN